MIRLQTVLGYIFLALGLVWAAVLLRTITKQKFDDEPGRSLKTMLLSEAVVYIFATMGISDFLMNTILFNRYKSDDPAKLPGTVNLSTIVPGAVIAFTYLKTAEAIEPVTLIVCTACMLAGTVFAMFFLTNIDGKKLKKIIGAALICSMIALIVKMIVTAGTSGTASGVSGVRMVIAVIVSLICGALNMLGVPCKPTLTALFLLLGMSPMCTLSLLLVMCGLSPIVGGVKFLKSGMYHKKTVLAAATAGTVTAVGGCLFMITIPAMALNIILLCVMLIAVISMFKK